jgi:hypothetical protein
VQRPVLHARYGSGCGQHYSRGQVSHDQHYFHLNGIMSRDMYKLNRIGLGLKKNLSCFFKLKLPDRHDFAGNASPGMQLNPE